MFLLQELKLSSTPIYVTGRAEKLCSVIAGPLGTHITTQALITSSHNIVFQHHSASAENKEGLRVKYRCSKENLVPLICCRGWKMHYGQDWGQQHEKTVSWSKQQSAVRRKDKIPTPVTEFAYDASKPQKANQMVLKHAFHIYQVLSLAPSGLCCWNARHLYVLKLHFQPIPSSKMLSDWNFGVTHSSLQISSSDGQQSPLRK